MKSRRAFGVLNLILLLAVLLLGCEKDNTQELIDKEARLLEQYLIDNNITVTPRASGLYYIPILEGTGNQPSDKYWVDFNYSAELVTGTVIGTSIESVAKNNDLYQEDNLYGPLRLSIGFTGVPGLDEGITFMKEGGKAKMILPSDINGMGGNSTNLSPSYSTHIYEIELINTFEDPEQFQTNQIILYMQENGIDSVYVTDSGLHYISEIQGRGETIKNGDIVDLYYTGKFLDGRVFDSNVDGTAMTVDIPATGYIKAWDEAIKLMNEKAQATFIVPYQLAYGSSGNSRIPPYMPLVFEIEIDKVTPL